MFVRVINIVWILNCYVWTGCVASQPFGSFGFLLIKKPKIGINQSMIAVPGATYHGESCSSYCPFPLSDGFEHMEFAVQDALKEQGKSKFIGLADVTLSQEIRWYFLYTEVCWKVSGLAAKIESPAVTPDSSTLNGSFRDHN